jgi:oligopeptidase B
MSNCGSVPADLPAPVAPVADRRPAERVLWGDRVVDALGWLRNRDDPGLLAHLEAENAYTDAVLAPVAELQAQLFAELKSRIKETDLSVPVAKDGWAYYSRTVEGLDYGIHCRRPVGPGTGPAELMAVDHDDQAGEVVLLDENLEAGDSDFFDVGPFDVSPDHQLLFWGWDRTGDERYTATIRDLATGADGPDELTGISAGSAWSLDGQTVFYLRPDETNRPCAVWRHRRGTDPATDVCVFQEDDERYFVGVGLEKDHSFIQISASSKVTDEVWLIPADDPEAEPRLLAARRTGVEYSAAHHRDLFVILTNDEAENFRLVTAPDTDPGPGNWRPLEVAPVPGDEPSSVTISDFDVAADHLVLFERANGATRIRVRRWADGALSAIDQPEPVSTVWPGANPDYETTLLRYGYSSMVSPASVFTVDLISGERTLLKQQEVLGGFDPGRYATARLWATGADGTRIPISTVARRDRPPGPGPCLLYVYGAYEASLDPTFSSARLSLLDRGFTFAVAHVRGGGEMGRRWYLEGKLEHKPNTFADTIACARHLLDAGITSPPQFAIRGGSAGGLTVGAVLNEAPELFAAAVAEVPFVDALNSMLDASLPLTVTEWDEWGNPAEESIYRVMRNYSPYENLASRPYPSVLATAGLNDTRVGYWEPAKWVQELRAATTAGRVVLLWTDLGAGHGGPSGRYDAWREEARILAYILWALGLNT